MTKKTPKTNKPSKTTKTNKLNKKQLKKAKKLNNPTKKTKKLKTPKQLKKQQKLKAKLKAKKLTPKQEKKKRKRKRHKHKLSTELIPYIDTDNNNKDISQLRIEAFIKLIEGTPRDNSFLKHFYNVDSLPQNFHTLDKEKLKYFKEISKVNINLLQGFCCISRQSISQQHHTKQQATQQEQKRAFKEKKSKQHQATHKFGKFSKINSTSGIEPIWTQLYFEPDVEYELFQFYNSLEQKDLELVYNFSEQTFLGIPKHKIMEFFIFYYWEERAKAYVIQKVSASANTNSLRQVSIKEHTYQAATSISTMIQEELAYRAAKSKTKRSLRDLTGAQLLKAFNENTATLRISADLARFGNNADPIISVNTNIQQTMQQATSNHEGVKEDKTSIQERELELKTQLANDPKMFEAIQKLAVDYNTIEPEQEKENTETT